MDFEGAARIAKAIESLGDKLGTNDAAAPMGATEVLSVAIKEGFESLSNAISDGFDTLAELYDSRYAAVRQLQRRRKNENKT